MNEYLRPIFEIVLPVIEESKIFYSIYGGLGYAAMAGKCYRTNLDVDIFVLNDDFNLVESLLADLCKKNNWKKCKSYVNGRNKLEVYILKNGKKWVERLSFIPINRTDKGVQIKFREGIKIYSNDVLKRVYRILDDYCFYTVSDEFLVSFFKEYLNSKQKYPSKRVQDARYILSKEEFGKYFPNELYEKS